MSSIDREACVFKQIIENPEEVPQRMASVFSTLPEEEPDTPDGAAEVFTALEAPICNVTYCKLSIQGLLQYVTSASDNEPRHELDGVVAPSCTILDAPHAAEELLGLYEYPDDPRTQD